MTVRRMRVACWISKATRAKANARSRAPTPTHTQAFTQARTQRNMSANTYCFCTAPTVSWTRLCYVIRTLPVLLYMRLASVNNSRVLHKSCSTGITCEVKFTRLESVLVHTCVILWWVGGPAETTLYVSVEPVPRLQLQFPAAENIDN
jgi:hypothetical protein